MESNEGRPSLTSRYLAALLAPAVIAGLMQVTWPFFEQNPVLPFLLPVIFCAWYGGLGSGLLALIISFLLTDFFFIEPYFAFWFPKQVNLVRLLLFAVSGSFISVMSELMHRERRRAEINLESAKRAAEERSLLAAIVESSEDAILSKTLDGRITSWNASAERMYGYTAAAAVGCHILFIVPPERVGELTMILESLQRGEQINQMETVRVRKDGGRVDISVSISPIKGAQGQIVGAATIARDITERKRVEQRLREYEKAVEGLDEMIVVVDRDYHYLLANRAFLNYRGLEREQLVGRPVPEVLNPGVFEQLAKAKLDECFAGNVVKYELEYKYPQLGRRDLFLSYFPIEGPTGIDRVACVLKDITESKRAEEQIKATSEQVRALSASLALAREEEATRIAREIHDELGAALSSLRWDLEEIDEAISKPGDRQQLKELRKKMAAMIRRTDTTIDIVRRIASELRPIALDTLGLIEAIEWQARQFQDRTGIIVQRDCTLESLDLSREQATAAFRIFQEALTNVLRHAEATRVNLGLKVEDGEFIFQISDNGRGITDDVGSGQRTLGIVGMRERAHLVGGKIEITGPRGSGTVVTVQIPISGKEEDSEALH